MVVCLEQVDRCNLSSHPLGLLEGEFVLCFKGGAQKSCERLTMLTHIIMDQFKLPLDQDKLELEIVCEASRSGIKSKKFSYNRARPLE